MTFVEVVKTSPPVFEPRTLALNFETKEQWDTFRWMMSFNVTIPDLLYGGDKEVGPPKGLKLVLEDMMTCIHNRMRDEGMPYDI